MTRLHCLQRDETCQIKGDSKQATRLRLLPLWSDNVVIYHFDIDWVYTIVMLLDY